MTAAMHHFWESNMDCCESNMRYVRFFAPAHHASGSGQARSRLGVGKRGDS